MKNDEIAPGPKRTSIRRKLLIAFAVPVLVVAVITGFQANQAQRDLDQTERDVAVALIAGGPSAYVTAVMNERNISALELLGLAGVIDLGNTKSVPQARSITDDAQAGFVDRLQDAGGDAEALYEETFEAATKNLGDVRKSVEDFKGQRGLTGDAPQRANEVYQAYTLLIASFHEANAEAVAGIDDAKLRNRADAIAQISLGSDLTSRLSRNIALPLIGGSASEADKDQWKVDALRDLQSYDLTRTRTISNLAGSPKQQKVVSDFYAQPSLEKFVGEVEYFGLHGEVEGGNARIPDVIGLASDQSRPNTADATNAAIVALTARGDQLIDAAQRSRNIYLVVFLFATGLSILLALLVARSITKPLLSIASQADEMARKRLPQAVGSILATPIGQDVVEPTLEPISVNSRDEVADVAASINVVQQRALSLAVEQAAQRRNFADTFLNLGRRVQGLVARQLDFITDLEESEQDPDALADLFKLDHLATRIRRNAESLVVLAGVTRRQRRGAPVPILDALRSALGEVDEYTRVEIGEVDPARLPMSVASDVAHILAELIENGLNFSPPDSNVQVTGRLGEAGYEITVVDHGIGMPPDRIATANRRLSGNESFTVAPSRYMGHFVAGHLATGLGIDARLTSTGKGVTATVLVPAGLLAADSQGADDGDDFAMELFEDATEPSDSAVSVTGMAEDAGATAEARIPARRRSDEPMSNRSTHQPSSFQPAAPPPAPSGESETLRSLLAVHRSLSRSDGDPDPNSGTDPGLSPWAQPTDDDGRSPRSN